MAIGVKDKMLITICGGKRFQSHSSYDFLDLKDVKILLQLDEATLRDNDNGTGIKTTADY